MRRWLAVLVLAGCGAPTLTTDTGAMDAVAMDTGASSEGSVLLDAASEESAVACVPACAAGQLCVNGACFAPVDAAEDAQPVRLELSLNDPTTTFIGAMIAGRVDVTFSNRRSRNVTSEAAWLSENPAIVRIGSLAMRDAGTIPLTVLAVGETRITATYAGLSSSVRVVVRESSALPILSIALNPTTARVGRGGTVTVSATATREDGSAAIVNDVPGIQWVSSATPVATVVGTPAGGAVTGGPMQGTAMITAQLNGVTSGPCIITTQ